MPADLTREEIERMRDLAAMLDTEARATMTEFGQAERLLRAIGRVGPQWVALVDSALSEPTRLAQARAEGCREGIEAAIADAVAVSIRDEVDSYEMRDDGGGGYSPTDDERIMLEDFGEGLLSIMQTRLRALSPPPAEPAQPDDGWIEWKGGECPVEPDAVVEVRMRDGRTATFDDGTVDEFWWGNDGCSVDIIAYRIVKPAEPSAPVAPDWPTRCAALEADGISARKRIATLKAENAALRERAKLVVAALHGPGASARQLVTAVDGLRALLQGGADAATV